jgi:DNA-binding IclR family transcriptional regulator
MPRRTLIRLYELRAEDIQAAGLGNTWKEFLAKLRSWRVAGHVLANSEVDRARFGIAAPVLADRKAIGSLSFVLDAGKADERTVNRLAPMVMSAAREIEKSMQQSAESKTNEEAKTARKSARTKRKRAVVTGKKAR